MFFAVYAQTYTAYDYPPTGCPCTVTPTHTICIYDRGQKRTNVETFMM